MLFSVKPAACCIAEESALGGEGPNAVLCETCSVLLCVLNPTRVDNSNVESLKLRAHLGTDGPIGLRPALHHGPYIYIVKFAYNTKQNEKLEV
jgi:hypothetical protein